jgi:hypothetical protein
VFRAARWGLFNKHIFNRPENYFMKTFNTKFIILTLLLIIMAVSATAVVVYSFSDWGSLTQNAPDIIVARCSRTPDPYRDHGAGPTGSLNEADIEVISILKGLTNWGTGHLPPPALGISWLTSEFYPRQGEFYLIFSIFHDGEYQASESYRVVPLGLMFNTNSLSGKTLDEQIQMLLQRRLNDLNRQMKEEQAEKQRLEEGIKK